MSSSDLALASASYLILPNPRNGWLPTQPLLRGESLIVYRDLDGIPWGFWGSLIIGDTNDKQQARYGPPQAASKSSPLPGLAFTRRGIRPKKSGDIFTARERPKKY